MQFALAARWDERQTVWWTTKPRGSICKEYLGEPGDGWYVHSYPFETVIGPQHGKVIVWSPGGETWYISIKVPSTVVPESLVCVNIWSSHNHHGIARENGVYFATPTNRFVLTGWYAQGWTDQYL